MPSARASLAKVWRPSMTSRGGGWSWGCGNTCGVDCTAPGKATKSGAIAESKSRLNVADRVSGKESKVMPPATTAATTTTNDSLATVGIMDDRYRTGGADKNSGSSDSRCRRALIATSPSNWGRFADEPPSIPSTPGGAACQGRGRSTGGAAMLGPPRGMRGDSSGSARADSTFGLRRSTLSGARGGTVSAARGHSCGDRGMRGAGASRDCAALDCATLGAGVGGGEAESGAGVGCCGVVGRKRLRARCGTSGCRSSALSLSWTGVLILVSPARSSRFTPRPLSCRVEFPSQRSAALASLVPFDEFEEEALALFRRINGARTPTVEKLIELVARGQCLAIARQPFLGRLEPGPAGHHCREVCLAPLRMPRRLLELGTLGKETTDEFLEPTILLASFWPIIGNKHCAHRDGFKLLASRDEAGIILTRQDPWQIVLLQLFGEGHRQKAQAGVRRHAGHSCHRLAGNHSVRRDLAGFQFFEALGLSEIDFFDLHVQSAENVAGRDLRSGVDEAEINLLARKLLD